MFYIHHPLHTDSEEYHNPTDKDIEQMGLWETEYRYTDLFKLFFALDEYGQNDVEALIHSQLQRCREQGTTKKLTTLLLM